MLSSRQWMSRILLVLFCSCATIAKEILRSPLYDNLGLKELKFVLEQNGINGTLGTHNFPIPPKFMIELYQQQATEDLIYEEPKPTVTCILGKIKREIITFNLTSLSGESFSQADIHIFRKKSGTGKMLRIKFFVSHARKYLKSLGRNRKMTSTGDTIRLLTGRGWERIDVTKIIKSKHGKWELLGVGVEGLIPEFGTGREIYHGLPLDEQLRISYKPFLIIFGSKNEPSRWIESLSTSNPIGNDFEIGWKNNEFDNFIMEKNIGNPLYYDRRTKQNLWTTNSKSKRSIAVKMDSEVLALDQYKWKQRKAKLNVRRRLKKPNSFVLVKGENHNRLSNTLKLSIPRVGACELVERWISLVDITWGGSILAPASIPFHACRGVCPQVDFTQNIVGGASLDTCNEKVESWSRNKKQKVTNGCCRASSFRRLSVLYINTFGSIVLQSFGKSRVGTCSC